MPQLAAGFEVVYVCTELVDKAGHLEPGHKRPGRDVPRVAATGHDVLEVHARVGDANDHLASAWLGNVEFADTGRGGVVGGFVEGQRLHLL